jgi:hypothetical protein
MPPSIGDISWQDLHMIPSFTPITLTYNGGNNPKRLAAKWHESQLVQALEEFPIKLKHILGKSNGRADALS